MPPTTSSSPAPALNAMLDSLIPADDPERVPEPEEVYLAFNEWAQSTGRPLYPHQDEALSRILEGRHVIAATPTGSGKSMIALAAHTASLARGGRSYYTAPLKALVSEKFFELVRLFGADNVGMVTGDTSINAAAPIICCTAEILANQSLREGEELDVDTVVMDEFHYYADPQRGWAWQVPLRATYPSWPPTWTGARAARSRSWTRPSGPCPWRWNTSSNPSASYFNGWWDRAGPRSTWSISPRGRRSTGRPRC